MESGRFTFSRKEVKILTGVPGYACQKNMRFPEIFAPSTGFEELRQRERIEFGEDFQNGAGYSRCVADYWYKDSQSGIPNNKLLEKLSSVLGISREKIVPVMAGSCSPGEYLDGLVEPDKIVAISPDLDIIICETEQDAIKLRIAGPTILPLSVTRAAIESLEKKTDFANQRQPYFLREKKRRREHLRALLADLAEAEAAQLAVHIGTNEIIKGILRMVRREKERPKLFIPLPNYFKTLEFASECGFQIIPSAPRQGPLVDSWLRETAGMSEPPDIFYLSNPNNPTGTYLNPAELEKLIQDLPTSVRIIIDEVSIDRHQDKNFFALPWRELAAQHPDHHLIFLDSLSKSHDMSTERIGCAIASKEDDRELLRRLEPSSFSEVAIKKTEDIRRGNGVERSIMGALTSFYGRLDGIIEESQGRISLTSNRSNFCTILFREKEDLADFSERISKIDPSAIGARRIVGLPIAGSGEITAQDLMPDGSLREETFKKKGIPGLSDSSIRLSALSHQILLTILQDLLA